MKNSLVLLLLLLSCSYSKAPVINGFFIQPSLSYGGIDYDGNTFSTQEQFDSWVKSMADVGAKYLIYQWSARYEHDQTWYSNVYQGTPSSAAFAYYDIAQDTIDGIPTQSWSKPTTWPGHEKSAIDKALDACEHNGMKLWLGLYLNEGDPSNPENDYNWWDAVSDTIITHKDSLAIEHNVARSLSMIDDIANQFGNHPAFGGIYFTVEVANVAFITPTNFPYLASILDRVSKRVHDKIPGARISISPFFNTQLASAEKYGTMWKYALSHSTFDVVILQDGAGVDPFSLTETEDFITPYYLAMKEACDSSGTTLWANSELFTQDEDGSRMNPKFIPSNIDRIKLQLETESTFVDTFVCFGFHYMDPNPLHTFTAGYLGNLSDEAQRRETFYNEYKAYYDSLVSVGEVSIINESKRYNNKIEYKKFGSLLTFESLPQNSRIAVYSIRGKLIVDKDVKSEYSFLNLNSLSTGLYILNIETEFGKLNSMKLLLK